MGPGFAAPGPVAFTSTDLVALGRLPGNEMIALGLEISSGAERWRATIAQGTQSVLIDGVALGSSLLAVHPTRPQIILWRSTRDGVPGLAVYDYQQRRITAFHGPIGNQVRPAALQQVMAPDGDPAGCLAVAADVVSVRESRSVVYLLCGSRSWAERDSVILPATITQAQQLQAFAGGTELLLGTTTEIVQLEVAARRALRRAARPFTGPIARSAHDGRFFLPDPGSTSVASGGLVMALTSQLELSAIIDLHVLPTGDRPLGIQGAAVSEDGKWLYLVGGVPRSGPLYGPQTLRILVVNVQTGAVADIIRLGSFGGGTPLLVP
jgi:hypothetical protein